MCFRFQRQWSVCTAGVALIDLAAWHDWSHQLERDGCTVIWGCWTSIRPLPLRRIRYKDRGKRKGGAGWGDNATWLLGLVAGRQSNLMRLHRGERKKIMTEGWWEGETGEKTSGRKYYITLYTSVRPWQQSEHARPPQITEQIFPAC